MKYKLLQDQIDWRGDRIIPTGTMFTDNGEGLFSAEGFGMTHE